MRPPHQRLGTGQMVIPEPVLGLKKNLELPILKRKFHAIDDGLLAQQPIPEAVVIERIITAIFSFDALYRQHGSVTHLFHGQVPFLNSIDAPFDINAFVVRQETDFFAEIEENLIAVSPSALY